ncbi:DUF4229 domain-containing protein [Pseudactinotalea sp. HY160]|nr:DUF4229 domain-containing protein [Pseudactinotalea sp. HY160]QGH70494.1 DUF4229 domain-containing protein [Pseudactinotalea sp. HY158]
MIARARRTRGMDPAYAGTMLVYAALRILLLLAAIGGLYLLGLRGWLLAAVAIIVAAMLSYVLLPRPRDRAAGRLAQVAEQHGRVRTEPSDEEIEDAAVDGPGSGEHGPEAEDDAEAELEQPGVAQHGHEGPAGVAAKHAGADDEGEDPQRHHEQVGPVPRGHERSHTDGAAAEDERDVRRPGLPDTQADR